MQEKGELPWALDDIPVNRAHRNAEWLALNENTDYFVVFQDDASPWDSCVWTLVPCKWCSSVRLLDFEEVEPCQRIWVARGRLFSFTVTYFTVLYSWLSKSAWQVSSGSCHACCTWWNTFRKHCLINGKCNQYRLGWKNKIILIILSVDFFKIYGMKLPPPSSIKVDNVPQGRGDLFFC